MTDDNDEVENGIDLDELYDSAPPKLALSLFPWIEAGLRTTEINHLEWEDVQ